MPPFQQQQQRLLSSFFRRMVDEKLTKTSLTFLSLNEQKKSLSFVKNLSVVSSRSTKIAKRPVVNPMKLKNVQIREYYE